MSSTLDYFASNAKGKHFKLLKENIGQIKTKSGFAMVYFPDSSEYAITEDVVMSAKNASCNIIVYASTWGSKTHEAEVAASRVGIKIVPFGTLFKLAE